MGIFLVVPNSSPPQAEQNHSDNNVSTTTKDHIKRNGESLGIRGFGVSGSRTLAYGARIIFADNALK
jgi:hypothetical protein